MFFITVLGTAVLFLSYTAYQIKIAERNSKANFYQADAAMSQIRAGVGQAVTASLGTAYTGVLEQYSSLNQQYETSVSTGTPLAASFNDFMQQKFQSGFQTSLMGWTNSNGALFQQNGLSLTYSPAVLLGFLTGRAGTQKMVSVPYGISFSGGTIVLSCTGAASIGANGVTLKGITLTYTASNGYSTKITTDIVVQNPPFAYTPSAYSESNLAQFALIAQNGLTCGAQNLSLQGDAYAGTVSVTTNGASLTHSGGALVSGGDVDIDNSGQLTTSASSILWAKNIKLGSAGLNLAGKTYVANDLALSGSGANAVLSGEYCGFGYYPTAGSDSNDASGSDAISSGSSSILVNGRNESLNLSGLTSLMLAGNSFIDAFGADSQSGSYLMGQSIAGRSDQLAYLVPADCLPESMPSNPCLVSASGKPDISGVFPKVQALAQEEPYYQYVDGVQDVYVHLNSTGTDLIAYLFLTFNSRDHANQFFKGYFSAHSTQISQYLSNYLSNYSAAASVMSGGNTYSGSMGSGLGLADAASESTLTAVSKQYAAKYQNLCETLSESISSPDSTENPYEYIVDTTAVATLPDGETDFKDSSGNTVAVIQKGNCVIQDNPLGSVKILITAPGSTGSGDVTVNKDFTGLILSSGTVTMKANVNSSSDVSAALQAVNSGGQTLLSFLNIASDTQGGSSQGSSGISWNVNSLVGYANWSRH